MAAAGVVAMLGRWWRRRRLPWRRPFRGRRGRSSVHDPRALVRVGPQALVGGDPAGMRSCRVPSRSQGPMTRCRSPRSGSPTSATAPPDRGGRAAPQELRGGGLAAGAHQHREQARDLGERPGRGPPERTARPHSAPLLLEHPFERTASQLRGATGRPGRRGAPASRPQPPRGWCRSTLPDRVEAPARPLTARGRTTRGTPHGHQASSHHPPRRA
jgi:hypothetical protein